MRFGNVLGSNGSVIPIFSKQISDGGPITVTHPEMRRYFMTIPEASQLVLQAGSMGQGGEIFILDMGQPVLIADLARKLIRLSGLRPDLDIRIVYTGMRPGEKLNEELTGMGETVLPTCHEKIRVHQGQRIPQSEIAQQMDAIRSACSDRDADGLLSVLKNFGSHVFAKPCPRHNQPSGYAPWPRSQRRCSGEFKPSGGELRMGRIRTAEPVSAGHLCEASVEPEIRVYG